MEEVIHQGLKSLVDLQRGHGSAAIAQLFEFNPFLTNPKSEEKRMLFSDFLDCGGQEKSQGRLPDQSRDKLPKLRQET